MSDAAPSPYSTLPGEGPYDVAIGSALITMVEPHEGHEHAYNRWYEDDHFYSGAMAMPWMFAGRRWVAPRHLQALRYPDDSLIAQPLSTGKYISLYWITDGRYDDHMRWTVADQPAAAARRSRVPRPHARVHVVPVVPGCRVPRRRRGPRDVHSLDYPYRGSSSRWSTRPTTATTLDAVAARRVPARAARGLADRDDAAVRAEPAPGRQDVLRRGRSRARPAHHAALVHRGAARRVRDAWRGLRRRGGRAGARTRRARGAVLSRRCPAPTPTSTSCGEESRSPWRARRSWSPGRRAASASRWRSPSRPATRCGGIARFGNAAAQAQLEAAGVRCVTVDLATSDFTEIHDDFDYVVQLRDRARQRRRLGPRPRGERRVGGAADGAVPERAGVPALLVDRGVPAGRRAPARGDRPARRQPPGDVRDVQHRQDRVGGRGPHRRAASSASRRRSPGSTCRTATSAAGRGST